MPGQMPGQRPGEAWQAGVPGVASGHPGQALGPGESPGFLQWRALEAPLQSGTAEAAAGPSGQQQGKQCKNRSQGCPRQGLRTGQAGQINSHVKETLMKQKT